ncbi:hypothetical protein ACRXCV_00195 (plasmid) [Halobacteriovorax sp. GFR7]|uniref:hypothetical protein n=1 Tax=unclassified Halobacteriovorax TaxID=2639665 RepID=UPI003D99AA54
MAVPIDLAEYLARLAVLEGRLKAKIGSDQGEIFTEVKDLMEYTRQNTGALAVPSTDIFHGGFVDYNDLATATTPLNVLASTETVLPNDAGGAFTNTGYLPQGMTGVWDNINDQFDWQELKLGDMVDIRFDIVVTTTQPNQEVNAFLRMAIGSGSEYDIPFLTGANYKTAKAHPVNRFNGIYMGDSNTLDNPAQFIIESDAPCSVVVNGWYCKIIRRGAIV